MVQNHVLLQVMIGACTVLNRGIRIFINSSCLMVYMHVHVHPSHNVPHVYVLYLLWNKLSGQASWGTLWRTQWWYHGRPIQGCVDVTWAKFCIDVWVDDEVIPINCINLSVTGGHPDSKVHGANMGPIWGRQDPGGPHVGHMNLDIWDTSKSIYSEYHLRLQRNNFMFLSHESALLIDLYCYRGSS